MADRCICFRMTAIAPQRMSASQAPVSSARWMALRWPVALVISVAMLSSALGQVLRVPIKVQLVMDAPLPVKAAVDVDGIRSPIAVEGIRTPLKVSEVSEPLRHQPIQVNAAIADPVRVGAPLTVNVSELAEAIAVKVNGPLEAKVEGAVTAQVAGDVRARVSGEVGADLRGTIQTQSTIDGTVHAELEKPIRVKRLLYGLW